MKKNYIQPQVKACTTDMQSLMDGSVVGNNGAGWGGVDKDGSKDPDANDGNVWDDDVISTHKRSMWDE